MSSSPRFRILALHGGMSCGKTFRSGTMKKVIRQLRDIVEFEFIDAPFMTRCPIFVDGKIYGYQEGELSGDKRSWWYWNDQDPTDDRYGINGHSQEGLFYHGFDQTLETLWRVWSNAHAAGKPFDGIFGFSQGAITASIFADWMIQTKGQDIPAPPKCMILVSAFLKPVPLNYPEYWMREEDAELKTLMQESYAMCLKKNTYPGCFPLEQFQKENPSGFDPTDVDKWTTIHGNEQDASIAQEFFPTKATISTIPSLHLYGKNDTIMPTARSLALATRYVDSTTLCHSFKRAHDVPSDVEGLSAIRTFVEKYIP